MLTIGETLEKPFSPIIFLFVSTTGLVLRQPVLYKDTRR
jgi:hypothetical protein